MHQSADWDEWLIGADSVQPLAPEGYDFATEIARVRALDERLSRGLPAYKVRTASPELSQDGTRLTHSRITSKTTDSKSLAGTLAWVLLSRFGNLATVKECDDRELLAQILGILQDLGLRYIDYDYLVDGKYGGKCPELTGLSWANRYFALVVDYNTGKTQEAAPGDGPRSEPR